MKLARIYAGVVCAVLTLGDGAEAQTTGRDAIELLSRPGHHAMIRHALAPGSGDPADFTLGDCRTQRNLDAVGRAQAGRLGAALRAAGIGPVRVLSSEWCRALETAQLMDLGPVTLFPALNSTLRRQETSIRGRPGEMREVLLDLPLEDTTILVTHASTIAALTGRRVSSGAGVVIAVTDGALEVVGTFASPRN